LNGSSDNRHTAVTLFFLINCPS